MKKIILPILLCVVAVAVAIYFLNSGDRGNGRAVDGAEQQRADAAQSASGVKRSAVGVPRAVDVEAVVAGGVDEGLASAPVREVAGLVDVQRRGALLTTGMKAGARVDVDGRSSGELVANEFGEFPKVYVVPGQAVKVRVSFPDAEAGSRVVAQVEDGGRFGDGKPVAVLDLDEKREASFDFTVGDELGIYRIALRRGADWKYVQLWARGNDE